MENKLLLNIIQRGYIYGLPIVGMYEFFHKQILDPTTKTSNLNEFSHTTAISSPKTSFVPAPNNDTTYSRAWLDLTQEPVIITVPDTNDRYYTIHLLDLFSETIANIGKRLNGTKSNSFAIVGPTWQGNLPDELSVIKSNTTLVLAFLRILVHGQDDLSNVAQLQNMFKISYLSEYLNSTPNKVYSEYNFPKYNTTNYYEFFRTLKGVLDLTIELDQDIEILKQMKQADLLSDAIFNIPEEILEKTCNETRKLIDDAGLNFGEVQNYWRTSRSGIGNYGNDYFQRAIVWYKGALANQPEESLYPTTFQDEHGERLNGNFNYEITFEKESFPPASQFWSITMYDFLNAFLVDNEINRYSIGNRTRDLYFKEDGSLTIYIQNKCPEDKSKKANWLPSPLEPFFLTLRLYGPSKQAIVGEWIPPIVKKITP